MARFRQFHDPELSIWQSAVDEVVAQSRTATQVQDIGVAPAIAGRPDLDDPMMADATAYCNTINSGETVPETAPAQVATENLIETAGYCSLTALKLAKARILGNSADAQQYADQLTKFGGCDARYALAAAKYVEYFLAQQKQIPYIPYQNLTDFVIDGQLPVNATVAVVGDWGTGQDAAQRVLRQIANKNPDVVIHLGDIYYAGTQCEVNNYFLKFWRSILNLDANPIPTFTLSGNHDMYSGGVAYYNLIQQLGQPASYFCLRNDQWQFVAMDTGYNDHNPSSQGEGATFLQDPEVAWLSDKVQNAGGRRTILLSHHQLFTAFDHIDQQEINLRLYAQVADLLPKATLWLWGHEHIFVPYGAYRNLAHSCCLGHGAFPVTPADVPAAPNFPDVPLVKDANGDPIRVGVNADGFYNHGYAIIKLNGASCAVSYYQDSDEVNPMLTQTLG